MADELSPAVEELLECPVCLTVPREGPLPSCPVGEQVSIEVFVLMMNHPLQVTLFASLVRST